MVSETQNLILMPGDVFCTKNPMALGRGICAVEAFWATDGKAEYSHSGIIRDMDTTLECLWTVKNQNLFEAYAGERVILARYVGVKTLPARGAIDIIEKEHLGKRYPWWRIFLHLVPPLARINWTGKPVCSELTAKYLWMIGARHEMWKGVNPDTLADEWRNWKNYMVYFEGELNDARKKG